MSRTLSKVLIICALVVVLPLMIAGTAFAAYYAINATVSIEIFVDQLVDGGRAEVSYNNQTGRIDKKLEVTDGHLKKVTFKTSAVGYNFVGWYAGTYKAYTEALASGNKINYAIGAKDAKVNMTDYQNLVAVFEAKHYTVSYNYINSPENGVVVQTAPSSDERFLVDGKEDTVGKTDFVYGEKLHTIELKVSETYPDADKWSFDGWYVGTKKYTTATFTETGAIELTGNWVEAQHISLTYLDENGNELTTTTAGDEVRTDFYANYTYDLLDPMSFTYGEGFVENGYAYTWKDVETGNALTKLNSDKPVTVKIAKSPVVYRAKLVYDDAELQLKNVSKELTFSIENKTTLDVWKDADNWEATYPFWHFDYLTYNGSKVTDFTSIIDSIINSDEYNHASTEITINAVKKADLTAVALDEYSFASESEEDSKLTGPVYKDLTRCQPEKDTVTDFSKTLYEIFDLLNEDGELADFYNAADRQGKVGLLDEGKDALKITLWKGEKNEKAFYASINETTTLNDLLKLVYERVSNVEGAISEQTLTIDVVVCFQ